MGRCDLFDPVVAPKPARTTERRYPALGAYPCPGEDEDSISGRYGEHGSVYAASGSDSLVVRKQVVTTWSEACQTRRGTQRAKYLR